MEHAAATARSTTAEDFRTLVETHQSRVYSIAVRILQDPGAAEEVAQDVFLALYRNLDAIQCEAHLMNWLRRVTVQRATDACRRRAVRLDFGAEEFLEDGGSAAQAVAQGTRFSAPDGDPLHRTGVDSSLEHLVGMLPSAQRSVVVLRYQEDMTPMEIAEALAMPLGTVKSNLQRSLKLLRTKLQRQRKEAAHA